MFLPVQVVSDPLLSVSVSDVSYIRKRLFKFNIQAFKGIQNGFSFQSTYNYFIASFFKNEPIALSDTEHVPHLDGYRNDSFGRQFPSF